jgi:rare lipoprotein A
MMLRITLILFALVLSGCTAIEFASDFGKKLGGSDSATGGGNYKIGKPYQIKGVWYYPERDLNYDETGIASWYGDKFAGKKTASGVIYNPDKISAAHKTLPLPSAVRVTNLDNGRSLNVVINDRGPFIPGRIIDMSREGARLLGFQKAGVARIRVQILAEESLRLEREARQGKRPRLGKKSREKKPKTTAAPAPKVTLSTSNQEEKETEAVSAIDLLASSRVTEVIEVGAVKTDIYIQVGAFTELKNARLVVERIGGLAETNISTFDDAGRRFHRVRMGPFAQVAEADAVLEGVINSGYSGARIILD